MIGSIVGTIALGCGGPPPPPPNRQRPDLVLISIDTLRADRLGYAGHAAAHTPNVDRIAASGRAFTEATTPLPRTTPALGTLQTGLRPTRHGSREVGQPVLADGRLAGWLADAGWQTFAISAIAVAGPKQRMDLGFQTFLLDHDAPAPKIVAQVAGALGDLDPNEPAYLWVHFADPHFPYLPDPSGPLQPEAQRCRATGKRAAAGKLSRVDLFIDRDGRASRIVEECSALYDAEIAVVDQAIGSLLAHLDAARPGPRYVAVTADHGENLGEDGLFFEHGPSLHDADVQVPLVIAGPGIAPGTDAEVARTEDIAPTLMDLLGLPVPPNLDGVSLAARARGTPEGAAAPREPIVAPIEAGSALQLRLFTWPVSGRSDRWCLNDAPLSWCTFPQNKPNAKPTGLYDHRSDPGLTRELSTTHPEDAARLKAAAARWRPERTRPRLVRTPDKSLLASPKIDGWRLAIVDSNGTRSPLPPRPADPAVDPTEPAVPTSPATEPDPVLTMLQREMVALAQAIAAADGEPVPELPMGTDDALRALGYIE